MEDFGKVRCRSLSAGSGYDQDMLNSGDHMVLDSDHIIGPEPTPAEVAQCEAEVSTLLNIIAELNKKMGSLKAPSDPGDTRTPVLSRPPDLLSHRLLRINPTKSPPLSVTTKPPRASREGAGIVWTKLQEVLSSVEDSISYRRIWAAPITASDQEKQRNHVKATQENWNKASQILEEMEREFGISSQGSSSDQRPEDFLCADKQESAPSNSQHKQQEELEAALMPTSPTEEEKDKLADLRRSRRSGSLSPSYLRTSGAFGSDWLSPPYPGSPLLNRRAAKGPTPLTAVGDHGTPLDSASSCSSPINLDCESDRLNRYVERLKARNERLTAALERRKAESEHMSVKLSRLESQCSALQSALRYSEECEEAYSELLSLCDAKRLENAPERTSSAECSSDDQQAECPAAELRRMGTEELSTSFSSAGATVEIESQTQGDQRSSGSVDQESVLRQHIDQLKRERAAISLPKLYSESSHHRGQRCGATGREISKGSDSKREKTSLLYELISVREEMSDLRALIRLKEKELRCLEWSLMGQKAQGAAGVSFPETSRKEEDQKTEQQVCDNASKTASDGDVTSPLAKPILKELQSILQREQALKKRLALVHDSLNTALKDNPSHRNEGGEQIALLTQAHSKAMSSYRQIRRKYREQVWRLEQKVAAMMEESAGAIEAGEELEWRREETIL